MADKPKKLSDLKKQQLSLQKSLGIRRPLAWLLFLITLLGFLVIPVIASKYPDKVTQWLGKTPNTSQQAHTAFSLDKVWNPGPLSSVHEAWDNDCQACHTGDFSRVKDENCSACHKAMGLHVTEKTLPNTHFEQGRCASCHHDHKGRDSLAQQNKHFTGTDCASCHSNIKSIAPNTETEPVSDFAKQHPAFRLTLATGPQPTDLRRIRMKKGELITQSTHLKFPHDVHLNTNGINTPSKKIVMQCSDCHTPADTATGFLPITMEKNCQSCHQLNFEPALPDRQVPHGSVQSVLSTVDEFYSYLAIHPEEKLRVNSARAILRNRPGQESSQSSLLKNLSGSPREQARLATTELFEKRACAICHEVSKIQGLGNKKTSGARLPQYEIAPIEPKHPWMPLAKFDHKAHAFESCDTCHAAKKSKQAKDVLMPSIETCQTCHSGHEQVADKVRSECSVCHRYHMHKPILQNKKAN